MEVSFVSAQPKTSNLNKRTLALVSLALVGVFATCCLVFTQPAETDAVIGLSATHSAFQEWKKSHGFTFSGPEDIKRFQVFSQNYQFIHQHNKDPANTHEAGLNEFSGLTNEEFSSLHTGLEIPEDFRPEESAIDEDLTYAPRLLNEIPKHVDWRAEGIHVNPVKHQGSCGSCWAFATISTVESAYAIKNGKPILLSEQQLVDCIRSYGCKGGWMPTALRYIQVNGTRLEKDYPYKKKQLTCQGNQNNATTIQGYRSIYNNATTMKQILAKQPLIVTVQAKSKVFQSYKTGIITGTACGTDVDHAVVAVGYGVENGTEYFLVRNSWGNKWGDKGYVKVGIDATNRWGVCGINTYGFYPLM